MGVINKPALAAAAKMPPHKLGAWFESHVQADLKTIKERYPIDWLRLYDTKSAGSFLPAQPADFIVAGADDVYLLETKCSGKHKSLRGGLSSLVKQTQAVSHYTWSRSGHMSHFLFLSVQTGVLQLWDGEYVSQCRRQGKRLDDKTLYPGRLIQEVPAHDLFALLTYTYMRDLDVDIIL